MYRGRIGIKRNGHWQYKEFAMTRIADVYVYAEKYRQQNESMGVTIKFKEVEQYDTANKADGTTPEGLRILA